LGGQVLHLRLRCQGGIVVSMMMHGWVGVIESR